MTDVKYSNSLSESDEDEIQGLLVGRRVVAAEIGNFLLPPSTNSRQRYAPGRLTLDDGTLVYVLPNEGGCSCSSGDYELTHLATVDNIITAVRVTDVGADGGRYDIFVVADAVEINVLTVEGDDGNGYYGTGYTLSVYVPD